MIRLYFYFIAMLLSPSVAQGVGAAARFTAQATPLNALQYIHEVASHPRCANCHGTIAADGKHVPTVGDSMLRHPMAISSIHNKPELGMECVSCHQKYNAYGYGAPPGAANDLMPGFLWHMPPATMILNPPKSPREFCEQWTDPAKNGGRGSKQEIAKLRESFIDKHAKIDPLIIWAWAPGPERTPAPGSHELFLRALQVWIDAGAPCS